MDTKTVKFKDFIINTLSQGPKSSEVKSKKKFKGLSDEEIEKVTSDEDMKVWRAAFTDKSFPGAEEGLDNYESYEQYGDRVIKAVNTDYMWNLLEKKGEEDKISQKLLTLLDAKWTGNEKFAQYSQIYGFSRHIRVGEDVIKTTDIQADVMEAFFGALFYLVRNNISPGRAYEISYNIYSTITSAQDVSFEEKNLKSKVQQLKELFQQYYDINKVKYVTQPIKATGETSVSVFDYDNIKMVEAQGRGKDAVTEEAAEKALEFLDKKGINFETAKEMKKKRDEIIPLKIEEANKIIEALNESGYKYSKLTKESLKDEPSVVKRKNADTVLGLYTEDEKTERQIKLAVGIGNSWKKAAERALDAFIDRRGEPLSVNAFDANETEFAPEPESVEDIESKGGYRGRGSFRGRGRGRGGFTRQEEEEGSFRGRGGFRGRGRGKREETEERTERTFRGRGRGIRSSENSPRSFTRPTELRGRVRGQRSRGRGGLQTSIGKVSESLPIEFEE